MQHIRIDYYTGTGGSELVAKSLAKKLEANNMGITVNRIKRNKISDIDKSDADYYILIFPVHSFNAPKPIYEWVEHLSSNGCKTAVISVSGGGNILSNSASRHKTVRFLKKRGYNVIYEDMVRMPNNWMNVPDERKYIRLLSKIPKKIDSVSQSVLAEKRQRKIVYWIDYLISALGEAEKKVTQKFGQNIQVNESCNGCGICAKNCCSSNIEMDHTSGGITPKPLFGNRCDMCLGCIYNCPQKALTPTVWAYQIDEKGYDLKAMCRTAGLKI